MDNDSFFLVQYRNGKATEIGIQRELSKVASIKLFGLEVCTSTPVWFDNNEKTVVF